LVSLTAEKYREFITSSHNMKVLYFDFKETFDCTGFSKAPLYLIPWRAAQYGPAVVAYGHGLTGM